MVTVDNWLESFNAYNNYGTATNLYSYNSPARKMLMIFDISAIPTKATIVSAFVKMYQCIDATASTYNIYRIVRTWGELTSNWTQYNGSNNWGTAGCSNSSTDYTTSNSFTINSVATKNNWITSTDCSAMLNEWMGGTANKGVVVASTGQNLGINSADNVSNKPYMEVTYSLPASGYRKILQPRNMFW